MKSEILALRDSLFQSNHLLSAPALVGSFQFSFTLCLATLLTTALIPIIIGMGGRAHSGIFDLYSAYTQNWFIFISITSVIIGFTIGLERSFSFISHMFAIEKPRNILFTFTIWLVILGSGYASYSLSTP